MCEYVNELTAILGELANQRQGNVRQVETRTDLNDVPDTGGCYWIETTMPIGNLIQALNQRRVRPMQPRQRAPRGTELITQEAADHYFIYNGTENRIQTRLGQHLFNEGNEQTGKLGLTIDAEPFSNYQWRISYALIANVVARYATELWWRHNVGWPRLCKK